jgi:hypothetical protein
MSDSQTKEAAISSYENNFLQAFSATLELTPAALHLRGLVEQAAPDRNLTGLKTEGPKIALVRAPRRQVVCRNIHLASAL